MQESINTKLTNNWQTQNKHQSTWATARSELPSSDLCAASKAFSWGKIISDYSALLCWLCRIRKYYAHRCNGIWKESDWKTLYIEWCLPEIHVRAKHATACKERTSADFCVNITSCKQPVWRVSNWGFLVPQSPQFPSTPLSGWDLAAPGRSQDGWCSCWQRTWSHGRDGFRSRSWN